ncbi:hypothetical protein XELAEV_18023709mg [Xenopus laevis]|uniref:Urotensin-2 receptor n=1 Tax=Xenopus laevis TaxID=8355 RepID=A0A974D6J3_XENLA|nr:hypothetical protein XELAEV_18023709mg [Xenopus laevis]
MEEYEEDSSSGDYFDFPGSREEEILVTSTLSAVLSAMFLLGMSGNIYVLFINMLSGKPAGCMCVHVISLALADLLYLSTIPFVVSTYLAQDWYFGDVGCRLLLSMDLFTMHASIYHLTAMSVERYQAVVHPLTSRVSQNHHKFTSVIIWLTSLLLTLPMMCMMQLQDGPYGSGKRICFPIWTPKGFKCYLTVIFCTSILGPGLILIYLYVHLARVYWMSGQEVQQSQLAKLYQCDSMRLTAATQIYLNFGVTCLTYANSCVNPLLYTLLTRNYWEYLAARSRTTTVEQRLPGPNPKIELAN